MMNLPNSPNSNDKEPISELAKLDCKTNHMFGRIYEPKGGSGRMPRRILADKNVNASYHLMSRTCGGDFLLSEAEDKEGLRKLIWKMADFLFIRVQTYCIMDNHFHILVQQPSKRKVNKPFSQQEGECVPDVEVVRGEDGRETSIVELAVWEHRLLRHLSTFYSKQYIAKLTKEIQYMRQMNQEVQIDEMLEKYRERFGSIQHYMKEVKERYTRWYNKKYGRKGTLWMDRFKSVLVEDSHAKAVMAAYIDLNPVRAGMVKDPKDYRWCGYAEAEAGSKRARRGICRAMLTPLDSWEKTQSQYRMWLFEWGRELKEENGHVKRKGVDEKQHEQVFAARGKLPLNRQLLHKIAYFSTGIVIGSQSFVEAVKSGAIESLE